MEYVFLACAVVGGTIFVCQFILALVGFGTDDFDLADQMPHDVGGVDIGHALGGDAGHELGGGDLGHTDAAGGHGHGGHHGSTWLFGVISFRTVVAAITFFGLGGYAAIQSGRFSAIAIVFAVVCGGAAMYGVHWLMQLMYRLGQDRTLRIAQAVGQRGTVYVPIPGGNAGEGKVQISVQERLIECVAVTSEPRELPTGARVAVTRIISPSTVEVQLVADEAETTSARCAMS